MKTLASLSSGGMGANALSTAMERTFVGPLMSCLEDANSAPTMVVNDGGVEAVLGGHARGQAIGHGLRHGDGRDTEPGQHVRPARGKGVAA